VGHVFKTISWRGTRNAPEPATEGRTPMQVHRFHSPFAHWLSGLLAELAVMAAFIIAIAALAALVAWML